MSLYLGELDLKYCPFSRKIEGYRLSRHPPSKIK